jgi:hypothetical protein
MKKPSKEEKVSKGGRVYNPKKIGLEAGTYPANKRWQIDYDYLAEFEKKAKYAGTDPKKIAEAKEAQEALQLLSQFSNEFYGGKIRKGDSNALHNTDTLRKDCFNRNNASNNDLYAIKNSVGLISSISNLTEEDEASILAIRIEPKPNTRKRKRKLNR